MVEENDRDEDHKHVDPGSKLADVELGPIAMGPNLTPLLGPVGSTPPIPDATPELFVCLRGPCRHYWQFSSHIESGNPKETWDPEIGLKDEEGNPIKQPRQINRVCLVHPGVETELDDNLVYDCSRWDPLSAREVRRQEKAKAKYYKRHPEHAPNFVPVTRLTTRPED